MTRAWFILQHVAWEPAGLIAEVARGRGVPIEVRRMDQDAVVPSIDEVAGVITMGGPMGVRDAPSLPFLAAEMTLLRAAVERELPVLGVCLGAQLLAAALGARVEKGRVPEVGLGEVRLTTDGQSDPVLGEAGPSVPVVHWHEDTFEIPRGAIRLAETALYPNQAFRVGTRAYGVPVPRRGRPRAGRRVVGASTINCESRRTAPFGRRTGWTQDHPPFLRAGS